MKLKTKISLILINVFLFHILVNFYILNKSKFIRKDDEGPYIMHAISFHNKMKNEGVKRTIAYLFNRRENRNFVMLIGALIFATLEKIGLKDITLLILFTNALFLFILLISVYKIGSILYNKKIGLITAFILSFFPIIFSYSRVYLLDFPLTSLISLCILSLLKTENFKFFFPSLLTAILFSFAQYTKETAIIFILPPFLVYSFRSLKIREGKKQRIINLAIVILIFLFFIGMVYLNPNKKWLFGRYLGKAFLIHNSYDYFYYLKRFPSVYFGGVPMMFLLPLLLVHILNIKKRNLFLASWFFIPLLLFSILPNKGPRFLMPILPSLSLLLISEVSNIQFSKIRKTYIVILIFSSIFQYIILNSSYNHTSSYNPVTDTGLLSIYQDKNFYSVDLLLNTFEKEIPNKISKVIFSFDTGLHYGLGYELAKRNMPFQIYCPQEADKIDSPPLGKTNWREYLLTADYVVDKTGDIGRRGALEDIAGEFKESLKENAWFFKEIASFNDSNGDSILVYKKLII